jgi:hypothetical protein
MLTDQQLTETALRFVRERVAELLDPTYEMDDYLDKLLCEHHCPPSDCDRTEEGWPRERDVLRSAVHVIVGALLDQLDTLADAEVAQLEVDA